MRFNPLAIKYEKYIDEYEERDVLHFRRVSSTNIVAKNLAINGSKVAVIADSQFMGRGRMSRLWESEVGGLYLTLTQKIDLQDRIIPMISMAASIAALRCISDISGLACRIKWPNDVLVNNKKICGVLSEAIWGADKLDFVLVGFGLNINQSFDSFSSGIKKLATSIYLETEKRFPIKEVAFSLIHNMNREINEISVYGPSCMVGRYRRYCETLGKRISVFDGDDEIFEGEAIAINEDGALVVKDSAGKIETFLYGEVSNRMI
ncbi:biotin--[acetyl-CoA-carboxylase] ligase [Cloacibacillus sp. An23]|uniref:biotin--[acetyl-CoA-carboxylase] ligase n=1 Tax=Cloacibacillus sp. An23 TaxID=1965591 RepID=UPI000B39ADD7|nr:biotin--[acetyl-CoA-carboxylase] ligase [Cloacibacillus sp. An23]OUO92969.1 biotin--[acetyl-CoA-carboxylase] ligase [Cloacibacillus sp. An23]